MDGHIGAGEVDGHVLFGHCGFLSTRSRLVRDRFLVPPRPGALARVRPEGAEDTERSGGPQAPCQEERRVVVLPGLGPRQGRTAGPSVERGLVAMSWAP